jgi:dolichol kinase
MANFLAFYSAAMHIDISCKIVIKFRPQFYRLCGDIFMNNQQVVMLPGDCAGDYSAKWTKTFDLWFLNGWILGALALAMVTWFYQPGLFGNYLFFAFCLVKLAIMILMSLAGGMLCRRYCQTDERGYIITCHDSWFKVNYTRKLQHFAAYLVPLISFGGMPDGKMHPHGILPHLWESLLVLLVFLLLIKPVREHSRFFMLQFNSLDRPEDRPHTLQWIILGNILPGLILGTVFKEFFEHIHAPHLVFIIIFIVGIGDGLAEPVGIYWGKKKYLAPAWFIHKRYVRSYAGSACVYLSGLIFTAMFYSDFNSLNQFFMAMLIIPPLMTFLEATAPHSMDTPTMMIFGFTTLYLIAI